MGTGQRNQTATSALYDPEEEPSSSATGAAPVSDPAIIQPAVSFLLPCSAAAS